MKRLKKNPEIADYVVEVLFATSLRPLYYYFVTRKDARAHAKAMLDRKATRVRIFHMRFTLVSDTKPKAKK